MAERGSRLYSVQEEEEEEEVNFHYYLSHKKEGQDNFLSQLADLIFQMGVR